MWHFVNATVSIIAASSPIPNAHPNSTVSPTASPATAEGPSSPRLAWREGPQDGLLPSFGHFVKKRRRLQIDVATGAPVDVVAAAQHVSLAQPHGAAALTHGAGARTHERTHSGRYIGPPCHCALNIDAFIQCSAGYGEAKHSIAHETQQKQQGDLHQPQPRHAVPATTSRVGDSKAVAANAAAALRFTPPHPYVALEQYVRAHRALSPAIPACRVHELRDALPARYQEVQWRVLFASDVDGYSVAAMYRRLESSGSAGGACLLLAEVVEGASATASSAAGAQPTVVGAFLSDTPNLSHSATHFYGSPECFVFSFDDDWADDDATPAQPHHQHHRSISNYSGGGQNQSLQVPLLSAPHDGGGPRNLRTVSDLAASPSTSLGGSRFVPRRRRGQLRTHHSEPERGGPEHFILSSSTSLGVGGGPDGAALYFHDNLQRGTSSAACASFGGSPPLVGRARQGLRHSEFRSLRVFLLSLGDSDFVDYVSLVERARFHSSFLKRERRKSLESGDSARSKTEGNDDDDDDDDDVAVDPAAHVCGSCRVEPRGEHHVCSFIVAKKK